MSSDTITAGAGQAPEGKRNRRRFLAGVVTGLGALGLGRLASGDPAMAADGSNLILGNGNSASNVTGLIMDGTVDAPAFEVTNKGTGGSGAGVAIGSNGSGIGAAAIYGSNAANGGGVGVYGFANPGGTGVVGQSTTGVHGDAGTRPGGVGVFGEANDTSSVTYGVWGQTYGSSGAAVLGWSLAAAGGTGVLGIVPDTSGGTGVWGESNSGTGVGGQSVSSSGVGGQSVNGTGVMGTSGSSARAPIPDTGVFGVSVAPSGGAAPAGVVGDSSTNAGVAGFTSAASRAAGEFTHTAGGAALNVLGPALFAQSGLVAITAGKKSATVTGVALRAASLVLATAQNPAGVMVQNAAPNVTGSAITISLNKAVPAGMTAKVAWFVVN